MSQAPRQDRDARPLSSGPPLSLPTVREAATVQTPLNGSLIPRDSLGQRSDGHTYRSFNVATAGARKPTPSPLHTSFRPHSSERDIHESPLGHRSPDSAATGSPLEREPQTERIIRSSNSPVSLARELQSPSSATELIDKDSRDRRLEHGLGRSQERINGESCKMSDTSGSTQPSGSPPSSPAQSLPSNVVERTGQRTMPRTSSIDSAISSISSASHSHKSSFDSNSITSADINNLIAAAGSAEAVIVHLLKDKHHAAAQNEQLWRLLEKQRALVLGLNKDLERALKDKERYRKKLKELQSQVPPLPAKVSQPAGESSSMDNGPPGEDKSDTVHSDQGGVSHRNHRGSPQEDPGHVLSSPIEMQGQDAAMVPSAPHDSRPQPESSVGSSEDLSTRANKGTTSSEMSRPPASPGTETVPHSTSSVSTKQQPEPGERSDEINLANLDSSRVPSEELHPMQHQQEKILPPPNRKPPPAPLNLGQAQHRSSPIDRPHDSDSDYDDSHDTLEVDDASTMERGRRRTREEDDKEREAAAIREQEARSRSKKTLKVTAVDDTRGSSHQTDPAGLPSSPRKLVAQTPSHLTVGQFSAADSLAAVMSSGHSASTSLGERLGMTPPISPGLPVSPRPGDRPLGSPLPRQPREGSGVVVSPPTSPRTPLPGLPLSPRATKPTMPLSPKSNHTESATRPIPSIDVSVKIDSPKSPCGFDRSIYQGLVSDEYPGLLLPPNALPSIEVKVSSSRLRPSRNSYLGGKVSDEEPVFTLGIFSRSDRSELWRVEKVIMALPQLDHQIRQLCDFSGKLPDRSIFSGHSPAKIDARREALNAYFEALLDTPMNEAAALVLCRFLSSDAIEPRDDETNLLKANGKVTPELVRGPDGKPRKEGYLTKRGKNFGGWKSRYFVLHGPELKYYESPGGPHLGTIKIYNAQIGKQSQSGRNQSPSRNDDDSDNQYRHAFLILEPKKKDSSALVRHVLCAESDEERDAWVDALLQYVETQSSEDEKTNNTSSKNQPHAKHSAHSNAKSRLFSSNKKNSKGTDSPDMDPQETVQGFSYDDAVAAEPPVHGPSYEREATKSPPVQSGSLGESMNANSGNQSSSEPGVSASHSSKIISGPTNGTVIQDAGAWGNKPATSTKEKKRSIWGFRARSSSDLASQTQSTHESSANSQNNNSSTERKELVRPVFGIPLAEAVQFCAPKGVDVDLPAVVYRCIEYLRAKGAASEEGIFRLSGSNVVVKALKERFNTEGDVDFLAGDHYYDVHAVASLFKQYLRELPTTVLTRELHLDFLRVLDLDDKEKKIAAFNSLVYRLPKPNLALLRALVQFLIEIVNNSDVNKMTVRNVGIVFAPTLNIPAPVFSMFLTDFDAIFGNPPDSTKTVELSVDSSLTPQDVRSPRRQIFSEIPTPAYNQTSFHTSEELSAQPSHDLKANYDTGFIPMQPTYDQSRSGSEPHQRQIDHAQIPSHNRMLAPNADNLRSTKAKRRESSLLFMDLGSRKSALPQLRDDQALVTKESAFE
ncbi:hypothetical protein VTN77DRAFT_5275 [Rasamsonia byssochlamydoides]|uniref:uncharacterized protein n=1 Tax=Rasamsonia byssochlamydoides TaxID=89139 RepID=UPI0037423DBD